MPFPLETGTATAANQPPSKSAHPGHLAASLPRFDPETAASQPHRDSRQAFTEVGEQSLEVNPHGSVHSVQRGVVVGCRPAIQIIEHSFEHYSLGMPRSGVTPRLALLPALRR